jgi:hypothetical protein
MTDAEIRELIALAKTSTLEDFLETTKNSGLSREVLDVVWMAAQVLKEAEAVRQRNAWKK